MTVAAKLTREASYKVAPPAPGQGESLAVNIGALALSNHPQDVLVAYGLGSCVAVCLYDPVARVGGMIHSLLPDAPNDRQDSDATPAKFVDRGVPALVEALQRAGASKFRMIARLCGGAQMLQSSAGQSVLNVGERNVAAAEHALAKAGIRIQAQATGGNTGRTVRFFVGEGRVVVRSLGQPETALE